MKFPSTQPRAPKRNYYLYSYGFCKVSAMELKLPLFLLFLVGISNANLVISSVTSSFETSESACFMSSVESDCLFVYRRIKYLKRRIKYSCGHPGSFNPAVITNKEAHMVYGNMNNAAGTSQTSSFGKKKTTKISDYFFKNEQASVSETGEFMIYLWFARSRFINVVYERVLILVVCQCSE